MAVFDKGDKVRLSALFEDAAGTDVDPTAVAFKVETPAGVQSSKTLAANPTEVIKDSTGNYHYDLSLNAEGDWFARVEGTGAVEAATPDTIIAVRASRW